MGYMNSDQNWLRGESNLAPIAIFAFKRPKHLQNLLESLAKNPGIEKSEVYFFCDGPRHESELTSVEETRKICRDFRAAKLTHIVPSTQNKGLAKSIVEGVTFLNKEFGRVIVLEDDLSVSPYFLQYMNLALDFYSAESRVACIHGYSYPFPKTAASNYFLRGGDCWGWATWSRAWDLFKADGSDLLRQLYEAKLIKKFNLNGAYDFREMLVGQIRGENNSWAIRWHASLFLANKLTLYPQQSMVQNHGFDNSGNHCETSEDFEVQMASKLEHILDFSNLKVEESSWAYESMCDFYLLRQSFFKRHLPFSIREKIRICRQVWRDVLNNLSKKSI